MEISIFSYFSIKTYVRILIRKCLGNICFHGEIRKLSICFVEKKDLILALYRGLYALHSRAYYKNELVRFHVQHRYYVDFARKNK